MISCDNYYSTRYTYTPPIEAYPDNLGWSGTSGYISANGITGTTGQIPANQISNTYPSFLTGQLTTQQRNNNIVPSLHISTYDINLEYLKDYSNLKFFLDEPKEKDMFDILDEFKKELE